MEEKNSLTPFEDINIRRKWHKDEWWFSVSDIVYTLTGSADVKQYIKKMRARDNQLNEKWGTICTPLEILAPDRKKRQSNCTNLEGAFRIIQSIPSKKAEPLKLWLAKTGYERVQEIENPELAQKRIRETYRAKGYSNQWIEKRIRGIAVRDELTNEWSNRGIKEDKDFAILTAETQENPKIFCAQEI